MTALLFVLAAGLGASLRYATNLAVAAAGRPGWLGTLAVNVAGSFVLGALVGSDLPQAVVTVAGTGACGALTTFSTFALDAVDGPRERGIVVVVASLAGGLAAASIGYVVAG